MLVKKIMSTPVISVSPEEGIDKVAQFMEAKKIHGLPVVENKKAVGIITETDFFVTDSLIHLPSYINFLKKTDLKSSFDKPKSRKISELIGSVAKDIMTPKPTCVSQDDDLSKAIKIFKKTGFATLPVTNKNKELVGIITMSDVIQLLKK